jgi:hypothetical protein
MQDALRPSERLDAEPRYQPPNRAQRQAGRRRFHSTSGRHLGAEAGEAFATRFARLVEGASLKRGTG